MKNILLKTFLLFVVLLSANTIKAQWQDGLWTGKQAYNWYLPKSTGVNFETSPPTPLLDGQILGLDYASVGLASTSDSNGNLLFYTDGFTVWNRNHMPMLNGEGLLGTTFLSDGVEYRGATTALIVPRPGSSSIFYIFVINYFNGATYSEVDLSLDNGLGAITQFKNQILLLPEDNCIEGEVNLPFDDKISAVHHSDGNKIWVTFRSKCTTQSAVFDVVSNQWIPGNETNTYYSFLVTENGFINVPNNVTSNINKQLTASVIGQMKFSPDGTKLARVNIDYDRNVESYAEVFNFNDSTGELGEPVVRIPVSLLIDSSFDYWALVGCEFSPNGRYFYVLSSTTNKVFQFDLLAGNSQAVIESATLLYELNTAEDKYSNQMQLGPDGKIYISNNLKQHLHVINYPNNAGIAAGFAANSVELGGRTNGYGLPNFIASYFESGILHEGECAMQDVTFSTLRIPGIESIIWNFGDTSSGADNTSTDLQPAHIFATPGTYTVTAVITSNGAQQTATTQVVIVPGAAATAPQGDSLIQCADTAGNATFNLNQFNSAILNGQDADNLTVTYYASEADMESGTPIATTSSFVTAGQALYVKVVNTATQCSATTTFTLIVNPMPTATAPSVLEECADSTGEAIFDLTQQNAVILGNQDPALFSVNYYANEQDMQNNSAIAAPEVFASSGQTIYVVVNAIAGSNCMAATQFDVDAIALPELPVTVEFTGCSPFDLLAIAAQQGQDDGLSFYTTPEDAQDGTNAIADVTRYIVPGNRALLYVVATNAQGCENIGELRLEEGDCFIPRGISPNNDGLNDHFDLSGFDVNQLSIFNRYGQQVFSQADYTDQWHGQTDNNNELPTGTYYYYIKTNTGEQKTGWVYINREMN